MRKLATIEKVLEVNKHPNADRLEIITVRGWRCISSLGEFSVGDKCIFFEIDSLLPIISEFEFLAKNGTKKTIVEGIGEVEGYRLRTRCLRGETSQGLAVPIRVFPQFEDFEEGTDVTKDLNVHLYEPPVSVHMQGDIKGSFPSFLIKGDEDLIQNMSFILTENKDKRYVVTEKLDGTHVDFYKFNGQFGVCSHNQELKKNEGNLYWKMAIKYNLEELLPEGYAIQAEIVGEGIQKNRLKLKGQDIYAFYVFNIYTGKYLNIDQFKVFIEEIKIKHVPIVNDYFYLDNRQVATQKGITEYPPLTLDQVLHLAEGKSALNQSEEREGLVFRLYEKDEGNKNSFKAISNKYLLGEKE